jgi:hypothetical protein
MLSISLVICLESVNIIEILDRTYQGISSRCMHMLKTHISALKCLCQAMKVSDRVYVYMFPLFTIFLLDIGIVSTVWYFVYLSQDHSILSEW